MLSQAQPDLFLFLLVSEGKSWLLPLLQVESPLHSLTSPGSLQRPQGVTEFRLSGSAITYHSVHPRRLFLILF